MHGAERLGDLLQEVGDLAAVGGVYSPEQHPVFIDVRGFLEPLRLVRYEVRNGKPVTRAGQPLDHRSAERAGSAGQDDYTRRAHDTFLQRTSIQTTLRC